MPDFTAAIAQMRDRRDDTMVLRMERARRAAAFWPRTMPQQSRWFRWWYDHAEAARTVIALAASAAFGAGFALAYACI
jgi:hypothetical protein